MSPTIAVTHNGASNGASTNLIKGKEIFFKRERKGRQKKRENWRTEKHREKRTRKARKKENEGTGMFYSHFANFGVPWYTDPFIAWNKKYS